MRELFIDAYKQKDSNEDYYIYETESVAIVGNQEEFLSSLFLTRWGMSYGQGDQLKMIYDTLVHFESRKNGSDKDFDMLVKEVYGGVEAACYTILYLMDSTKIIDYGTSIRCSWLTELGEELFKDLKQVLENRSLDKI